MNVCLLSPEQKTSSDSPYIFKSDIAKDLNFSHIYGCMAKDDSFMNSVVSTVMMIPLKSGADILYRQEMLQDVLQFPAYFEQMYYLLTQASVDIDNYQAEVLRIKKSGSNNINSAVFGSLDFLNKLMTYLEELKRHIDATESEYTSAAMKKYCKEFNQEFNPEFINQLKVAVSDMTCLREGGSLLLSSTPGLGMHSGEIVIHEIKKSNYKKHKKNLLYSVKGLYTKHFKKHTILLDSTEFISSFQQFMGKTRYETGDIYRDLIGDARKLEKAALTHLWNFFQDFTDRLSDYFETFRYQIAFYLGCQHLYARFSELSIPLCFPTIPESPQNIIAFEGLYDLSLSVMIRQQPVGNKIHKENIKLFIISGANQGGKSTFLRSFATAQVMMHAGIFVPALSYHCSLCGSIFTHFTRREDAAMNSGRLDEELERMHAILEHVKPNDMVFLNESFSSTTEKEGSVIAFDIAKAFYESNIKLFTVTHLHEFTQRVFEVNPEYAVFYSAQRKEDGTRTFKMIEMPPSKTSFGMDLYEEILGE